QRRDRRLVAEGEDDAVRQDGERVGRLHVADGAEERAARIADLDLHRPHRQEEAPEVVVERAARRRCDPGEVEELPGRELPPAETRPDWPIRKLSTSCDALRDAASIAWPWSASARPRGVGCSGRRPLRNSGSPSRFSSIDRVRDTAGWVRPIKAAPSVTPPA